MLLLVDKAKRTRIVAVQLQSSSARLSSLQFVLVPARGRTKMGLVRRPALDLDIGLRACQLLLPLELVVRAKRGVIVSLARSCSRLVLARNQPPACRLSLSSGKPASERASR